MAEEKSVVGRGRPSMTQEEKNIILTKIEPYLRSGLSVRKSLIEAKVHPQTFYRLMERDEHFSEQINAFRQFVAVLLNSTLISHMQSIIKRQNDPKGSKVTPADVSFLQWMALNSNLTRDEWGERKTIDLYDPEIEINRIKSIIDERSSKEIDHGE